MNSSAPVSAVADVWGAGADPEAPGRTPRVEPCRSVGKRKRGGKDTEPTVFWFDVYRTARETLKKAGMYSVGSAEDRCILAGSVSRFKKHLRAWVQVRHYQCKYFVDQLRDYGRITPEMAEACMYEIDAVLDYILMSTSDHIKRWDMGNAWLWAAMQAQQQFCMANRQPMVFDSRNNVELWSLQRLNEDLQRRPHPKGIYAKDAKRMHVSAEEYSGRTHKDHAASAQVFNELLRLASPRMEDNPNRDPAAPWFVSRVANALKPMLQERNALGQVVLVEVD